MKEIYSIFKSKNLDKPLFSMYNNTAISGMMFSRGKPKPLVKADDVCILRRSCRLFYLEIPQKERLLCC